MEKSDNLTDCLNMKALPLLKTNLMISVSDKMFYQEAMGNSLRSRKSQEKSKSKKQSPP